MGDSFPLFWGVMLSQFPFQVSLLEQARPSPITVQSGGTRLRSWATHPNLATFLCCSLPQSQCHQISAEQRDQALQLAPLYLKAYSKKGKPSRHPRKQQAAPFQRLGFPAERRLQSIFILRQKKQTYLADCRGRNDGTITCRTARY